MPLDYWDARFQQADPNRYHQFKNKTPEKTSQMQSSKTLITDKEKQMGKAFGAPEQAKIKQIVAEGVTVMQEIQDLTEGLNDTIKAVAEELDIKPSVIRKAIRIAQKDQWDQVYREFDDLETIVDISGHANIKE